MAGSFTERKGVCRSGDLQGKIRVLSLFTAGAQASRSVAQPRQEQETLRPSGSCCHGSICL